MRITKKILAKYLNDWIANHDCFSGYQINTNNIVRLYPSWADKESGAAILCATAEDPNSMMSPLTFYIFNNLSDFDSLESIEINKSKFGGRTYEIYSSNL